MEKIYRVQMNSSGMPNFATGEEIPQGEWIETDMRCYGATVYKCSVCGDDVDEMPTVMGVPKYKFCPNCGARMRPKLQGKHFDSIIIDESAMKGADDE